MKAVTFGTVKFHAAALPAPARKSVTSGLTRPEQPGAPSGVRSSGSGPNAELVLLKPIIMTATDSGRLLRLTVSVVPTCGRVVLVRLVMPSEPAQPAPKKP